MGWEWQSRKNKFVERAASLKLYEFNSFEFEISDFRFRIQDGSVDVEDEDVGRDLALQLLWLERDDHLVLQMEEDVCI